MVGESDRLSEIEQELAGMGADSAYCRSYFRSCGGTCERVVGGTCKRHRIAQAQLPAGRICQAQFAETVRELRRRRGELEACRARLRREFRRLRGGPACDEAEARKTELKHELSHCYKELQDIRGDLLEVLLQDPVDAPAWHDRLTALLLEKIALLERLKLGLPGRATAAGASVASSPPALP